MVYGEKKMILLLLSILSNALHRSKKNIASYVSISFLVTILYMYILYTWQGVTGEKNWLLILAPLKI